MQSGTLLNIAILSGVIGFAVYCLASAAQVWKARNAAPSTATPPGSRLRRLAAFALLAGLSCIAAAIAFRAAVTRDGLLTAENLFTLRAQKDMTVAEVATPGTAVVSGTPLARFHSPSLQSELAALKLKKQILEAEQRIVSGEPVAPDPETARRRQELAAERRHVQASRDWLLPEVALVTREQMRDRTEKLQELVRLAGEIERARAEIDQAAIRKQLHDGQKKRTEALAQNSVASAEETAQRLADAKYSEAEVKKLERKLEDLIAEKQEVEKGLEYTQNIAESQADSLNQHIVKLRERLSALSSDEETVKAQLQHQLAAAETRRETKLAQLSLELQQCDHELQSLTETLTVPAPFTGTVAYRNPSPNTAFGDEPLVVLAAQDAFILRLRLPSSEAASLQKSDAATVELTTGIERRFTGKPLRWRRLADEPSYAVAELTCTPPAQAIRDLCAGKTVHANLLWTPPLYTQPLFLLGCLLGVCGLVGATRRAGAVTDPQTAPSPASPPKTEVTAPDDAPERLGARLRQSILSGDIDPHLLSAIEWSLDRHHLRSVQSLADALGDDPQLADRVESLIRDLGEESDDSFHARLLVRLTRILGAIAGPDVQDRLCHLRQHPVTVLKPMPDHGNADGNGNGNGNGNGKHSPAYS